MNLNLRNRNPVLPELRQLVQDLVQFFAPIAETRVVEVTAPYTVGMLVQLDRQPKAIVLARCFDPRNPSAVSTYTGAVDWLWTSQGAKVLEMRGLTAGTTTYSFVFHVLYD